MVSLSTSSTLIFTKEGGALPDFLLERLTPIK